MNTLRIALIIVVVLLAAPAAAQDAAPQTYTATYTYDAAGRLMQAAFSPIEALNYQYDAGGNLTTASLGEEPPAERDTTARARKEAALALVQSYLDHDDKDVRKKVEQAVLHIDRSLDTTLWDSGDGNHLHPTRGRMVFDEEQQAAKNLRKLLADEDGGSTLADAGLALGYLVTADQILASVAVAEAEPICATATLATDEAKCLKEIEKARKQWAQAEEELANGNPDKAIDKYGKAWEKAQNAVVKAAGQGREALATNDADSLAAFALAPSYPNPFNPTTTIEFTLPEAVAVRLVVYDVLGREVARLVDAPLEAGRHQVQFDASNLSSGTYLYRIEAGPFVQTQRILLVK